METVVLTNHVIDNRSTILDRKETKAFEMLKHIYSLLAKEGGSAYCRLTDEVQKFEFNSTMSSCMINSALVIKHGHGRAFYSWNTILPNIHMAKKLTALYREVRQSHQKSYLESKLKSIEVTVQQQKDTSVSISSTSNEIINIVINQKMQEVENLMNNNKLSSIERFEKCSVIMKKIEEYKFHLIK